jgi:hypothetical protein
MHIESAPGKVAREQRGTGRSCHHEQPAVSERLSGRIRASSRATVGGTMNVASNSRSQALHVSRRQLATSSRHRRLMPTDTISTKTEAGKSILIAV